ncbi:MAG TPA: hypothetical protein VMT59_00460 [Gaiellaceae bacterium]|nr:hypothetical protein [Gaiellaceae bacterium]
MPANSTAELHPEAERAQRVAAQQHLRIMIETMVRAGYSEPEITQAVERSTAPENRTGASASSWRRLRALFRS